MILLLFEGDIKGDFSMGFIGKFFSETYSDGKGQGPFGSQHFTWIFVSIALTVGLYQYFKHHPKNARIFIVIVCASDLVFRVINQTYLGLSGDSTVPAMALPWHLCTVMSFVLPIVVIFNIKRLKPAVYSVCLVGAIVSIFFGRYFGNSVVTFFDLEGMWSHNIMLMIPLIEIASGEFKLEIKNWWHTYVLAGLCTIWAGLGDWIFFAKYDTNYSLFKHNELGFSIPGVPYVVLYLVIFVLFVACMYGIPIFYRKINKLFRMRLLFKA